MSIIDFIIVYVIYLALYIWKFFVKRDDFNLNFDNFNKLVVEIKTILGDVKYIRTGSTACGISIGSSDIDIGIFTAKCDNAITKLEQKGYIITKKYNHFVNLTKQNNEITNGFDTDVKIYFDDKELERLCTAIKNYTERIHVSERCWIIAQKIWFNFSNQMGKYNDSKIAYYRKHEILVNH